MELAGQLPGLVLARVMETYSRMDIRPVTWMVIAAMACCGTASGAGRQPDYDLERVRREGTEEFARAVARLEARREELVRLRSEYQTDCVGRRTRVPSSRGRRSPYLDDEMVDNTQLPACRSLSRRIESRSNTLHKALTEAEEQARRAGVYPGTMREILRVHGFDRLKRR